MINPEDLPFEVAVGGGHSLAPDLVRRHQKAVAGPDPERQKVGRNNRKRGQKNERELHELFRRHGFEVTTQGGPNRRDFRAERGELQLSVEAKSIVGRWAQPAEVAKAWEQARRQAEGWTPMVVFSRRQQGVKTLYYIQFEGETTLTMLGDWFQAIGANDGANTDTASHLEVEAETERPGRAVRGSVRAEDGLLPAPPTHPLTDGPEAQADQ